MYRIYKEELNMASLANKLKVVLFLGSTREGRLGLRVANFMKAQLEETNHDVIVFDPLEMKFPLLEKPIFYYGDRNKVPKDKQWIVEAEKKLKEADAFIVVTCEYNHSIPPALSNMIDHFGASCYGYRPSGIVCYSPGLYGGMRAAMQLRAMLGEIGCISVSNIFGIPQADKSIDEEGRALNDHMEKGAKKLISQLDWMAWAMKNHRDKVGVPS